MDNRWGQAQLSDLRSVLCLLRSQHSPRGAGERRELLERSRVRARSSLAVIGYVLSQEAVGA
ncbi:hypothetical protein AB0A69_10230 [Streptomyces sp. NPDC045431]|uniref:hypothetical protein n=1 Tax=Streptomyces sp. NPDC045431 TaxID=3155613 RepID=UPI0033ECD465